VFFDSPDALVPEDTNGKEDVYEWEPYRKHDVYEYHDGNVYLISDGKDMRV
jgi:hypothetical protein